MLDSAGKACIMGDIATKTLTRRVRRVQAFKESFRMVKGSKAGPAEHGL